MINIVINNEKYKCITDLSEINLKKSHFLFKLLENYAINSSLQSKQEILTYISEIPVNLIIQMDEKYIDKIINKLNISIFDTSKVFKIKNKYFKLRDLEKEDLCVEDYGQIEFLKLNTEFYNQLHRFINIIFKEVKPKNYFFKNILYNIYRWKKIKICNVKKYKIINEDIDYSDFFDKYINGALVYSIILKYNKWEEQIKMDYKVLWPEPEVYDDDFSNEQPIQEVQEENKSEMNFFKRWGIYHILCTISTSAQERDYWSKKNIRELFKYIVYLHYKAKEEEKNNGKTRYTS